ncbi:Acyl transferase/acyl hydrolase/lysophospholipase [Elaphomyces granulatus]
MEPSVLSLDGGGIRGLSSLYILRRIMKRIKELDDRDAQENRIEGGQQLPLPCNYFDLILGTSTGGLIAIMLGRLRMNVEDCLKQYWILSNSIFRPPKIRFLQLYSRRKVQKAVKIVVREFCRCHAAGEYCSGSEDLRQYDYAEAGPMENRTCRVAVITVREGASTSFRVKQCRKAC